MTGPTTATIHWYGTFTAKASISHNGETRGTITLLRRELIFTPDGRPVHVPIISGNAFRGRLRRIGEELLRDALGYEGQLSLPVAHALRSGGALTKAGGEPLSGARLARLRHLVPHVGVFGCAGGGRIIDGCLQVGKVVPHLAETVPMLDHAVDGSEPPRAFRATQIETYTRHDDSNHHAFTHTVPIGDDGYPDLTLLGPAPGPEHATTMQMLYRVETLPAGTRLSTWVRLNRATPLEVAFFTDVLDEYVKFAQIGGRAGRGHGHVTVELTRRVLQGAEEPADWVNHVKENRDAALEALHHLA